MGKVLKRKLFTYLFIFMTVSILVLPVMTTMDHLLTRFSNSIGGIRFVQEVIVPHEAKIMAVILKPLGFRVATTPTGIYVNGVLVTIWWSCIGWQSFLLVFFSLLVGLSRKFTLPSRIEVVILALLGFFFLTVFRLTSVAVVGAYFGTFVALIYHDFFAASLLTFLWLFFFWWFSYSFVLEEKQIG